MTESAFDWTQRYREGKIPWDSGKPSSELLRVVDAGIVAPCRALELGCGTGTNAVFLAQRGFDVTAVDLVELAVEKARAKATQAGVKVNFACASVLDLPNLGAPFEFIFDRGCFHSFKERGWSEFLASLTRVTRSGTRWLMLCGNDKEPQDPGPPTLSEKQIRDTLTPMFEVEWLREFRFDLSPSFGPGRPLAWSVMLRRR